jgi:hypothetical protein
LSDTNDSQKEIEKAEIINYLLQRGKALDDFMKEWQFTPYEEEQIGHTNNKLAKIRIQHHIRAGKCDSNDTHS